MSIEGFGFGSGGSGSEKYILFGLKGETYCLPILQTQEILGDFTLTAIPNLPDIYHGVISLRGEAIPVVNLRRRFGLETRARDKSTRVIVVDLDDRALGIEVDAVLRVVSISRDQVEEPPALTYGHKTRFVAGVTEIAPGRFSLLLDMAEILTSLEKLQLDEVRESIVRELTSRVPAEDELEEAEGAAEAEELEEAEA